MLINGCRTVNGGIVVTSNNDKIPSIEILSHNFHNPKCDILCTYYYDSDVGAKVEITLCRNLENGSWTTEVYFFHTREELQHYRSYSYSLREDTMPSKYKPIVASLRQLHDKIDFNNYIKRQ